MRNEIKAWTAGNSESIKSMYHTLHSMAEVSWKEFETTKYLCLKLDELGIPYETFDDITGVVGYWGSKEDGPTIGIRADIDSLWQLVDGEWKANHSCGHDAHMTMVLQAITCLKKIGYQPKGLIKIIFQPAEESGKGAVAFIEKGMISDVEYLLGIHVRPLLEISAGQAAPAIYHGATTLLKGEIKGIQAHGSRPNLGINVIESLGAIIQAVNSVKIDPTVSASAKVTMVNAGGENLNIIPDYASFGIDVRAERNDIMARLLDDIQHAVVTAGSVNRAEVRLKPLASMVAAESSPKLEEWISEAIIEALGEDGLTPPIITPGGEDFHFYKVFYPELQSTMVGLGTDLSPGLHHPKMTFKLDSLLDGVNILSHSLIKILEKTGNKKRSD